MSRKTLIFILGLSFLFPAVLVPGAWAFEFSSGLAYNPVDDRYLEVFMEQSMDPGAPDGTAYEVYGKFVDPSGTFGDYFRISPSDRAGNTMPAVAYDGANNRFLVVWQSSHYWDYLEQPARWVRETAILVQFVNADGTVGLPYYPIPDPIFTGPEEHFLGSLKVVYDEPDQRFLVVWQRIEVTEGHRLTSIEGQLVNADGTLHGGTIGITAQGTDRAAPAVAFNGSAFLVVWEDRKPHSTTVIKDIYGHFVTPDGNLFVPSSPPILDEPAGWDWDASIALGSVYNPLSDDDNYINRTSPALAYDSVNQRFLLAFVQSNLDPVLDHRPGIYGIWLNKIGLVGQNLMPHPLNLHIADSYPSLAYDSLNHVFLLAWEDDAPSDGPRGFYGQFVDADQGIFDGPDFLISGSHTVGSSGGQSIANRSAHGGFLTAFDSDFCGDINGFPFCLLVIRFEPVSRNTQEPYITGLFPSDGAMCVFRGYQGPEQIVVHIHDDDPGVDSSTIRMTVNGVTVFDGSQVPGTYPDAVLSGNQWEYTLTYTPPGGFQLTNLVNWTIVAADLSSPSPNRMQNWSLSFYTGCFYSDPPLPAASCSSADDGVPDYEKDGSTFNGDPGCAPQGLWSASRNMGLDTHKKTLFVRPRIHTPTGAFVAWNRATAATYNLPGGKSFQDLFPCYNASGQVIPARACIDAFNAPFPVTSSSGKIITGVEIVIVGAGDTGNLNSYTPMQSFAYNPTTDTTNTTKPHCNIMEISYETTVLPPTGQYVNSGHTLLASQTVLAEGGVTQTLSQWTWDTKGYSYYPVFAPASKLMYRTPTVYGIPLGFYFTEGAYVAIGSGAGPSVTRCSGSSCNQRSPMNLHDSDTATLLTAAPDLTVEFNKFIFNASGVIQPPGWGGFIAGPYLRTDVLKRTLIHEMGHALFGIDHCTTNPNCLLYNWVVNWTLDANNNTLGRGGNCKHSPGGTADITATGRPPIKNANGSVTAGSGVYNTQH
jgi:hypothetical protein